MRPTLVNGIVDIVFVQFLCLLFIKRTSLYIGITKHSTLFGNLLWNDLLQIKKRESPQQWCSCISNILRLDEVTVDVNYLIAINIDRIGGYIFLLGIERLVSPIFNPRMYLRSDDTLAKWEHTIWSSSCHNPDLNFVGR